MPGSGGNLDYAVYVVYGVDMPEMTFRVSEKVHRQVTQYAFALSAALGRRVSVSEALEVLLPPADEFHQRADELAGDADGAPK